MKSIAKLVSTFLIVLTFTELLFFISLVAFRPETKTEVKEQIYRIEQVVENWIPKKQEPKWVDAKTEIPGLLEKDNRSYDACDNCENEPEPHDCPEYVK